MILSEQSRRILTSLAEGHSIEQILAGDLALRYADVAEAAREALAMTEKAPPLVEEQRKIYPRAYEPWPTEEERRLIALVEAGHSKVEIASELGRQRSAIQSRLARLSLGD